MGAEEVFFHVLFKTAENEREDTMSGTVGFITSSHMIYVRLMLAMLKKCNGTLLRKDAIHELWKGLREDGLRYAEKVSLLAMENFLEGEGLLSGLPCRSKPATSLKPRYRRDHHRNPMRR